MHRKDIIEQYGFDPGENSSVVPKGDPTAAINVVPDDKKIEPPSQETESANPLSNLAAGAAKSFTSDPLGLIGLGAGVLYWAKKRLIDGDSSGEFADNLYQEGGLDRVQQHVKLKAAELKQANPDWDDTTVRDALERYTTSPEFFDFNTSQMIPSLGTSLKTAYKINSLTGVQKTPNQETFTDDTLQTLGGILTPTGFLKVGAVAQKVLGKTVGKVVGNVLEATVVPGIPRIAAGPVAANVAGGMAVDEVMRHATGDPTVFPSGEAFWEFKKEPGQLAQQRPDFGRLSPEEQQAILSAAKPDEAGMGTAATVAGLGLLGAGATRYALRGRMNVADIPTTVTNAEERAIASQAATTGLNTPDPSFLQKIIQRLDNAASADASLEQMGRELGINPEIEAEMGQFKSAHGKQLVTRNLFEDGVLPDGTILPVSPKGHFEYVGSLAPDVRAKYQRVAQDTEIARELQERRQKAYSRLNKNPLDPKAQDLARKWMNYDPSIRRYKPDVDEADLQVYKRGVDPTLDKYMDGLASVNKARAEVAYRAGIIDKNKYLKFLKNPYFTGLYDPDYNNAYNPFKRRDPSIDVVSPESPIVYNPISPESHLKAALDATARAAADNIGKRNIINHFKSVDPQGREMYEVPKGQEPNRQVGNIVKYKENGEEKVVQFARKEIADALNQSVLDDGLAMNMLNTLRAASQKGMVHLFAGPGQAPISMLYDMVSGNLTMKSGRSIGYLSRFIRQMTQQGTALDKLADVVEIVDPTKPLAYLHKGISGAYWNGVRVIGSEMITQATTRDGFFGHLAKVIPNGHQVLDRLGQDLNQYYHKSWHTLYRRWSDSGAHEMIKDFRQSKDFMQKDLDRWKDGIPNGAWEGVKGLFHAYEAVLSHVVSIHRMTFAAQNIAVLKARHGYAPEKAVRIAMEEARRSAGDMSAQPGNKALRYITSTVPFARIGVQSARHVAHSMLGRGAWDSSLVWMRMAGLTGMIYAQYKLMEELGLKDWFYETLNDFERNGKLWVPKIDLATAFYTGEEPKIDLKNPANNFYQLPLPQEILVPLSTTMYGLEQMGLINRGSNRGNTSAEKDLLYAAAQTFNLGNVPFIDAALAPTGHKIDLMAGARGRAIIGDVKGSKAFDGNLPSGIPFWAAEAVKSMFGFSGMLGVQTLDAGLQSYKETSDYTAALNRAWDEGTAIWTEKTASSYPGLWDGRKKVYGFTAMASEISRMNRIADELKDLYSNEFTPAGAARGSQRTRVSDPQARKLLYVTNYFFNREAMPLLQERLTRIRNKVDNLEASKGKLGFDEVRKAQEEAMLEMRPWYDKQMQVIEKYNAYITKNYGPLFQQYGEKPGVDSAVKIIKKSTR